MVEKSDKSSQVSHKMNIARDARLMVALVAGERRWGDTRQRWIERAARTLGFTYPRTRALFYCTARIITAREWIVLTQRIDALKEAEQRHAEQVNELSEVLRDARQGRAVAGGDIQRVGVGVQASGGSRHRGGD